jgi:hypothetical protein
MFLTESVFTSVTGIRLGYVRDDQRFGVRFQVGARNFLFSKTSTPPSGPNQFSMDLNEGKTIKCTLMKRIRSCGLDSSGLG